MHRARRVAVVVLALALLPVAACSSGARPTPARTRYVPSEPAVVSFDTPAGFVADADRVAAGCRRVLETLQIHDV